MNNWRSLVFGAVSTAILASGAGNLSADQCNSSSPPCSRNFCGLDINIGADFLWWKPCVDDLDVAAIVKTHGDKRDVDYESLCPDWKPGVRVYLEIPNLYCDWAMSASYTYLNSNDHASQRFRDANDTSGIISPLIFTGGVFGDFTTFDHGKQHWELRYNEWDVLFSYDFSCTTHHHFVPFIGVAGICLDQELRGDFSNRADEINVKVHWDSDYWGVGLRAGTFYQYNLRCGLSAFANAHATLLAGEAHTKNHQKQVDRLDSFDGSIRFKDDDCCRFIPGYHIAAGISYVDCWCNWEFGARLGYEFVYWHQVPNHRVFFGDDTSGDISHSTSPSTRSLAFHGILAGAWLSF